MRSLRKVSREIFLLGGVRRSVRGFCRLVNEDVLLECAWSWEGGEAVDRQRQLALLQESKLKAMSNSIAREMWGSRSVKWIQWAQLGIILVWGARRI